MGSNLIYARLNQYFRSQFFRYALVGVSQNAVGYLLYLLITWFGVDPKLTITILYPVGFFLSYLGNKKWTFTHAGNHGSAIFKFTLVHVIGYSINILMLYVFVDIYGFKHQYVQIAAIFILVFYFFVALKLYVFSANVVRG